MQEEDSKMRAAIALSTSLGTGGAGSQNIFQKTPQSFAIMFLIFS
jgi:hypothetical protein